MKYKCRTMKIPPTNVLPIEKQEMELVEETEIEVPDPPSSDPSPPVVTQTIPIHNFPKINLDKNEIFIQDTAIQVSHNNDVFYIESDEQRLCLSQNVAWCIFKQLKALESAGYLRCE